jgi:hypothetical protein
MEICELGDAHDGVAPGVDRISDVNLESALSPERAQSMLL